MYDGGAIEVQSYSLGYRYILYGNGDYLMREKEEEIKLVFFPFFFIPWPFN